MSEDKVEIEEETEAETVKETAENYEENPDTPEVNASDEKDTKKDKKESKKEKKTGKKEKELQTKLDELNDTYMRMLAEYDNFRKRSAKEREEVYSTAYADAAQQLLPIIDNLERAVAYSDGESLKKGVDMVLSQATEVFTKMGITEVPAAPGDSFDPELHNAVMHIDDEAFGENEISKVLQKGWKKGDKIIRHTLVEVAN